MSPAEALTRLHAAGRIRSAWLPGMGGTLPDGRSIRVANDHAPYWGGARLGNYVSPDTEPQDDPATVGCLLALLREAVGSPYLSPTWNAYLGRRHDPSDPGPDDFDNPPGDASLDNARQWRLPLCGVDEEMYDLLGTDVLWEGATEHAAIVAALVSVAEAL